MHARNASKIAFDDKNGMAGGGNLDTYLSERFHVFLHPSDVFSWRDRSVIGDHEITRIRVQITLTLF